MGCLGDGTGAGGALGVGRLGDFSCWSGGGRCGRRRKVWVLTDRERPMTSNSGGGKESFGDVSA